MRHVVVEEALLRRKLLICLSVSAAALVAPAAVWAQASGQASAPDAAGAAAANAVQEVVVTANRSPMPIDQVGQSVTVLTAPQIKADQETIVSDILARTPGVSFSRNGGPGGTTSVYIRGAESDQTVVLIDGVKVNDPSDVGAGYDFSNLLAGDISRIEILRGPQSALYGSEAIGGVVNIITAEPTKPLEGDVQAEGGSYGTAYVRGGIGGKEDHYDWRLGAYYQSTDGVSDFDKAFGGKEDDGFHTAGVSGRFRYDLTPDLQFDQRAYYTWSRNEFDGFDTPTFTFGDDAEFGRTQQLVDYTGLNLSLFDGRLKNRLAYEYNGLDRRNEDPDQVGTKFTFIAQGRANTIEYEGTFAIAPGYQLVFGAQSERSTMNEESPAFDPGPTKAHATINSGYGQIVGEVLRGLTLTGGIRYDDHSTFGDHVTGQASAAWKLNEGNTILRASFGQGFKAPSLFQLYSEFGNTTLRPEESNGWDAGVEQHFFDGRVVVQATYFGRETKNLIEFVDCTGIGDPAICAGHDAAGGVYQNVDKSSAEGVELQADWKASEALDFSANYTFDDAEDRSPDSPTRGDQLARRPKNTGNFSATYLWPVKLKTTAAVRYAGQSFDDDADTVPLKSYTLLDLRASYPLRDNLELYARVENLTDAHYETTFQYGTLGRAGYAGVRLSF
ncbi:TonB-dependent siderophore receptor [Caulobacter sp. S45]|uniref:TonB-dependent receptor plug domain-containing protein n=1 Tax=Caulobacter sp. S45 TaxID=1641861 RepID=UPI0020B13529|nr:TonB-dependent receptor [Caulobacter sp. S45]